MWSLPYGTQGCHLLDIRRPREDFVRRLLAMNVHHKHPFVHVEVIINGMRGWVNVAKQEPAGQLRMVEWAMALRPKVNAGSSAETTT